MQYGLSPPNFGEHAHPGALVQLARDAEAAGWDGLFLWDHLVFSRTITAELFDPWISLAAVATATRRLRLGLVVTPLARRRPWQVARQTATLDHLSGGRLVVGVGLGEPVEADFAPFGEETDPRRRAERLDESLAIVAGLWTGQPFTHHGRHFHVENVRFLPPPVQQPRPPVWIACSWPNRAPLRRAARWDGIFPVPRDFSVSPVLSLENVREIAGLMRELRGSASGFDLVVSGYTGDLTAAEAEKFTDAYVAAGATWWLESDHPATPLAVLSERVQAGPPRGQRNGG